MRNSLPDNTQIIQIRFYTVIWTTAYCNFKLMRQLHIMIPLIKIVYESPLKSQTNREVHTDRWFLYRKLRDEL